MPRPYLVRFLLSALLLLPALSWGAEVQRETVVRRMPRMPRVPPMPGPPPLPDRRLPVSLPQAGEGIRVRVNGTWLRLDVAPEVRSGQVAVPLRGVFERLGAAVVYEPASGQIVATTRDRRVALRVGEAMAEVDGRKVVLLVPAWLSGPRTLVPLRFVSEALGAAVHWDPAQRTVTVQSSGSGDI